MPRKIGLILTLALSQVVVGDLRREWVPPSMTAAEMWNPATWYYPYGIAAAESWAEYLKNAQQATNQLYQQWHATGAQWGWWSGGQSQLVPGTGGPTTPAPGALGQGQGNPGQLPSGQTPRPPVQGRGTTEMSQGTSEQPFQPTEMNQDNTGTTPQPAIQNQSSNGQYIPRN